MGRTRILGIMVGMLVCSPVIGHTAEHGGQEHASQPAVAQKQGGQEHGAAPTAPTGQANLSALSAVPSGTGQAGREASQGLAKPVTTPSKEQAGQPAVQAGQVEQVEPSAEQIREAIRDHILKTEQEDGAFTIEDEVTGNMRTLTLVRVHDRVGRTGDFYYSCTDMNDADSGESLDLDFDVDASSGTAEVIDVRIHKVNGKARYTYDEKDNRIPL